MTILVSQWHSMWMMGYVVRGTPAAQAEFYADLAKRFKYKPPTYLTETQALTYVGFTIREYRDSEGVQMRSIDCQ